ncbi:hypothetical protein [Amycolatopsis sp. NPDC098790]|uniref:hypothetical protein n=1 Tax=Amycolatopsis sp. NPDC098790 TaxID=3363939 RepID=UPI00382C4523
MSLDYEAWCEGEPDLPAIARTSTLIMRTLLGVDNTAVTPVGEDDRFWTLHWGSAAFAQVIVSGPEHAEVPGRWSLTAEQGHRGVKLDELLALVVVAAAALTRGGDVVDEAGRLPDRVNEPQALLLRALRAGPVGPDELVRRLRADG